MSFVWLVLGAAYLLWEGSGTAGDPYLISSRADFDDVVADANYWDDCIRLEVDINLAGEVYDRALIGCDNVNFTGSFDGGGHVISSMTISGGSHLGLFGHYQ